jgi:antitoxin ParD1/3/4
MAIHLPEAHNKWIEAKVADGTFASVDAAVAELIEERMALEADDMAWAASAVDEARADMTAGRVLPLSEHRSRNAERLAKLAGE